MSNRVHSFLNDDLLSRESAADDLEYMVSKIKECRVDDGATSIAIDSGWGTGKTFFLSMWENRIRQQGTDTIVCYNAWEYDDSDSSLLPMVYSILESIGMETEDSFKTHAMVILKSVAAAFIKIGVRSVFRDDDDIIEIINKGIDDYPELAEKYETIYKKFKDYFKYRDAMSETLQELLPSNGNLWFFIDDLDRCKPSFAIETLENIKHFFDIPRVNFVFAVNMKQLSNTISNIYGKGLDGYAYTKKFFDLIYTLPTPDLKNYVRSKLQTMCKEKDIVIHDSIIDYLDVNYRIHRFSLREIDQNITKLYALVDKYDETVSSRYFNLNVNISNSFLFFIFFLVIKDRFNPEYLEIIRGNFVLKSTLEQEDTTKKYYRKKRIIDIEKLLPQNAFISDILEKISDGGALDKVTVGGVIREYQLVDNPDTITFAQYMEKVLG